MKRVGYATIVLGATLACAHPPPPCECLPPTPPAPVDAEAEFKAGQVQFNLGKFDNAAALFSRAYEVNPLAAFLFNIGQCHWHLEDYAKALFFFKGYLREAPDAPNRKEVERLIKQSEARLKK